MRLDAQTKAHVRDVVTEQWRATHRKRFKFARGEKKKVDDLFTLFAEKMGERNTERFEYVLKHFEEYIAWATQRWKTWEHASRANWLGFMKANNVMEDFFIKLQSKMAETKNISGTKGKDEWAL